MEQLLSGLLIAAAGMMVVFLGLAVLMVVMMALTRTFRGPALESVPPLAAPVPGPVPKPDAKALAAALGAAIVLAQGVPGPGPRPAPVYARSPSPWGAAGRQQQAQPWRGKGRP